VNGYILASGLGFALSEFWNHPIRVNLIIVSAGLASLLPACIMAGYHFSHGAIDAGIGSLALYSQYVFGMLLGALSHLYLSRIDLTSRATRQLSTEKISSFKPRLKRAKHHSRKLKRSRRLASV
jgi:hypothetical protein